MTEPGPIIRQGEPEMPYFLDSEFTIAARDLGGGRGHGRSVPGRGLGV